MKALGYSSVVVFENCKGTSSSTSSHFLFRQEVAPQTRFYSLIIKQNFEKSFLLSFSIANHVFFPEIKFLIWTAFCWGSTLHFPTSKSKEVFNFALFSMCILTKAVPLFLGHFLWYESSKVHCSHGLSSWKCSETQVSHYFLFRQEVAQKTEFWGHFSRYGSLMALISCGF